MKKIDSKNAMSIGSNSLDLDVDQFERFYEKNVGKTKKAEKTVEISNHKASDIIAGKYIDYGKSSLSNFRTKNQNNKLTISQLLDSDSILSESDLMKDDRCKTRSPTK